MKRHLVLLLIGILALVGCKTADRKADLHEDNSFREMRTELMQQLRAVGATRAQMRDLERQLDVMERQMKRMERQMERMEKTTE